MSYIAFIAKGIGGRDAVRSGLSAREKAVHSSPASPRARAGHAHWAAVFLIDGRVAKAVPVWLARIKATTADLDRSFRFASVSP